MTRQDSSHGETFTGRDLRPKNGVLMTVARLRQTDTILCISNVDM